MPERGHPNARPPSMQKSHLAGALTVHAPCLLLQTMRALLTEAFRAKKGATEVHAVNRMIVQGRMELEETLMLWKGPSHVTNWFDNAAQAKLAKEAKPKSFLDNFYAGRPSANA